MIIVSQEKTKIVNFDNIAHIFISKDSEKHFLIEYGKMTGTSELLGVYSTEERAKEVLQEIIKTFSFTELRDTPENLKLIMEITKLGRYQMPKE